MINYLQGFCGPGNFLWFLLRCVLQGPGPKVTLSELLLFPIIVQNLSFFSRFFTPPPHSLLRFSISNFTTAWLESPVQQGEHHQALSNMNIVAQQTVILYNTCSLASSFFLLFNLNTVNASFFFFFTSDLPRLDGRNVILYEKFEKSDTQLAYCFTPLYEELLHIHMGN